MPPTALVAGRDEMHAGIMSSGRVTHRCITHTPSQYVGVKYVKLGLPGHQQERSSCPCGGTRRAALLAKFETTTTILHFDSPLLTNGVDVIAIDNYAGF